MTIYSTTTLSCHNLGDFDDTFIECFNRLGHESAQAQQLNVSITSIDKMKQDSSCTAIIALNDAGQPIGFAKVGYRSLFLYKQDGKVVECPHAPCLLDFYVSDSLQRHGIGLVLFTAAMKSVSAETPEKLAYDRPSPKLVSFLARHFQMEGGDLQPNRFMIFQGFL